MSHRGRRTPWSPTLVIAIAVTYLTVAIAFFATGYLIARFLL